MPNDIQVVIAIIGAIAFFAGLFGGFKAKDVEISALPLVLRIVSFVMGVVFISISIWPFVRDQVLVSPTPTVVVDQPATNTPVPTKVGCNEESTLERIKCTGIVRVGFAHEQPYAFTKPDSTLAGESIEVARVIFNRLGVPELEGVYTEFENLIPALQAGRFDIITAGMWIRPERCEQVLFADPEYKSIVDGETLFGAAAFRQEDAELRDAFNAELKKLKDSGELEDIITQFEGYVGDETSAAGSVTANEICNP